MSEQMIQQAPTTQVALYARVSSDRQDVDLPVAALLRALRDFAEKNDYLVGEPNCGCFLRQGASAGRTLLLPRLRRLRSLLSLRPCPPSSSPCRSQ